jgi:hypothetical protein
MQNLLKMYNINQNKMVAYTQGLLHHHFWMALVTSGQWRTGMASYVGYFFSPLRQFDLIAEGPSIIAAILCCLIRYVQ